MNTNTREYYLALSNHATETPQAEWNKGDHYHTHPKDHNTLQRLVLDGLTGKHLRVGVIDLGSSKLVSVGEVPGQDIANAMQASGIRVIPGRGSR